NTTVNHPEATIDTRKDPTGTTDYEGELAVIIGEGGRNIPKEQALYAVFGYTLINDVSSRALQRRHGQWFLGKSLDGYAPMGPAIVTADEISDVSALRIETRVNGELRQNAQVSNMIFDIADIIATISQYISLHPGDIIATGTPAGVGAGQNPPQYLGNHDEVTISVDEIGTLRNYFI
ncbi:MAG TPA: fumarylacetoacetate hydrolase family protein, partial [Halothiobacillaceae bacterium]|nr:fumarylacetoacetate hydrolase family protein [Halothiobacillaceae bacterium]